MLPPVHEQVVECPDVDFGLDDVPDFHARMDALRARGVKVAPVRYIGEVAWLLLDHADVYAAYRDDVHFPASAAYLRHSLPTQGRTLLCMEGEEHRIQRALVSRAFHPAAVRQHMESLLHPLANSLIDAFPAGGEIDLVAAFTRRYPLLVITRLLGIPADNEEQLIEWMDGLFLYPWDPENALKAKAAVSEYLTTLIHARRAAPQADLISELVSAEVEGYRLDDEAVLSFIRLLFPAGADTTYLALGSILAHVLRDDELRAAVLAGGEALAGVVEEGLRLYGTVCLQPRFTETGATVSGVAIPPGSVVLFGNAVANREPGLFSEPHQFDAARKARHAVTFGGGRHFCLGSHLARAEISVSLSLLLQRLEGLRVVGEAQPVGAVLRGVRALPVVFDAVHPAPPLQGVNA